ncbi:MAG: methyltransferase [Mariprofundus sp.]
MKNGTAGKILSGGETVVRLDDKTTVLVANAVTGDRLLLRPLEKRRGVKRAAIEQIIEAGPERIAAACPVAAACGGCALQFLAVDAHTTLKSNWVHDAFSALIQSDTVWTPATPVQAASRRRVRWMVGRDEQGLFAGFYGHASHRPVRHHQCMVLTPALTALHTLLTPYLTADLESVQAVEVSDGIHVILEVMSDKMPETGAFPDSLSDGHCLQWWWRHQGITRPLTRPAKRFYDALPAGDKELLLAIGPDDFVQGQQAGNQYLIAQIQQWGGKPRRIADLFCGIGNLSLPLAVASGAVLYGAELNPASVRAATANAKQLGVNAHFAQENLFEDFNLEPYIGADLLILDPPRRGAKRICSQISRLLPAKIVMVSCDPAAGARDALILHQHGYRLKALQALDLFAYAGHVEALSFWER